MLNKILIHIYNELLFKSYTGLFKINMNLKKRGLTIGDLFIIIIIISLFFVVKKLNKDTKNSIYLIQNELIAKI